MNQPTFDIKLYRNTHIPEEGVPHYHWECKVLTPEQELVWEEHELLPQMLHPIQGISPQELYRHCWNYEQAFNPKLPALDRTALEIPHLNIDTFLKGVAALIEASLIRAEVVAVETPA